MSNCVSTSEAIAGVESEDRAQLWNDDLAPTGPEARHWTWVNFAALWVGMVICVPAYLLASGLVQSGMAWWQAMLTVLLGNLIVLVPMLLIGHAGTRYGVPFRCWHGLPSAP